MTDKSATVLIVEDQEELAKAYETVVGLEYDTRLATSGEEALEKVDETVDVVLLDRRMPGMAGDQVLAEFVERGITAKVALLTAVEPDIDIVEMALDEYVTKPIDNDELLGLVETLLTRSEYDGQIQQFFRLAAKKIALEEADRDGTAEYEQLVAEIDQLREEIGPALDEISGEINPQGGAN